jgi:hypothetical protein
MDPGLIICTVSMHNDEIDLMKLYSVCYDLSERTGRETGEIRVFTVPKMILKM